ncbi:MAG: RNA polymerase sigma-54 factor, partial [Pseudomonadota bacterium]|nr:RNA polymerase sigma-54 factor [Pseudomonadota bacterium]
MAIAPRLELRQGQSLVMTPQLQQAIKLLQMNNMELKEFVEQELAENPLLERDESNGALPEEAPPELHKELYADIVGETDGEGSDDVDAPDSLESLDGNRLENVSSDSTDSLDMDGFDNVWDDGGTGSNPELTVGTEVPAAFSDWGSGGHSGFHESGLGVE